MIDDSLVWRLCEFTAWRCMTGAYLEVWGLFNARIFQK